MNLAAREAHAGDLARALETFEPGAQPHVAAGVAVDAGVEGADLGPSHARENLRHRLEHGDFQSELRADGRRLEPDITGADHDQARAGRGEQFQCVDIGQRAQLA